MPPISKAQQKAVAKYMKSNYDRLNLLVPQGQKATIQQAADAAGESINQFMNRAALDRMGLEEWPKKEDQ